MRIAGTVLSLSLLLLPVACGGGGGGGGGGGLGGTAAALATARLVAPVDIDALFARTLTVAPRGVNVVHWDPAVPPKVPPFSDTEIVSHGLLTVAMDDNDLVQLTIDFPADAGPNGFTLLPELQEPPMPGIYHIVHFEVLTDLPVVVADPTLLYEIAFVFDEDGVSTNNYAEPETNWYTGSDRWYELTYSDAQGWRFRVYTATTIGGVHTVTEVLSAAMAVIAGNSLTLVVPASEFSVAGPDYRVTAFAHDGDFGIPAPHSWTGNPEPRLAEGLQAYPNQN